MGIKSKGGFMVTDRKTNEVLKYTATMLSARNFVYQLEEADKDSGWYKPNRYMIMSVVVYE